MSRMIRLRALGSATLMASAILLGASVGGTPPHAQLLNRPLVRPLSTTPNGALSPNQAMQQQSFSNTLNNRAREQESIGGTAGANAMLRTDRQLNSLQFQ